MTPGEACVRWMDLQEQVAGAIHSGPGWIVGDMSFVEAGTFRPYAEYSLRGTGKREG